jgi:ANTAR domain-containing protein/GAF domain-containing protein
MWWCLGIALLEIFFTVPGSRLGHRLRRRPQPRGIKPFDVVCVDSLVDRECLKRNPMNQLHPSDATPNHPATSLTGDPTSPSADQLATATTYAELSAIVLDRKPLGAVLRRVAELAVKTIPNIDDASVTLIERGRPRTVAFSGQLAVTLDERQYEDGFGPCLDAARHGQTILVDTHSDDGNYPGFAQQARRQGIRHVLSIGMPALQKTSGGMNLYSSGAAGPFDDATVATASALAGHAAVTLFNAAMYAGAQDEVMQMKQAMASRAQIEQAKGVIMRDHRCTPEEAFSIMVDLSSRSNRKLRDVAQTIVTEATSGEHGKH